VTLLLGISDIEIQTCRKFNHSMPDKPAIKTTGLSKTFTKSKHEIHAVRDLNLEIQPGLVFGFLGPNGAGKTTTIRLLIDLIHPTQGSAEIFGEAVQGNPSSLNRVGTLVEDATFYNYMSGRSNLEILARTSNLNIPQRIDELLEKVHLEGDRDRHVGDYSTGMKQRLGLAAALLTDPELLILDEPTNGLDPGGILEMRTFIRDLVYGDGKTVFLSSHLLNEVEQVCDRVAIISEGVMIREGAVKDLLSEGTALLEIEVAPVKQAIEALKPRRSSILEIKRRDGSSRAWITLEVREEETPEVVYRLIENQIRVYQVINRKPSLEEYFLTVTAEKDDHGMKESSA
jgi:ABC-2 type transport system ATP-binding protein